MSAHRVVIIGAGPVGLAAASRLHARGREFLLLEAGAEVGAHVREWGHVRLFSPWRHLVDNSCRQLLELHGWAEPDPDSHPTGQELVRELLEPLAALPELAPGLRLHHRVTAVTRLGHDRMKTPGRDAAPFLVVAQTPEGEARLQAAAVIDASGTWSRPNPLGAGGIPAMGEREHAGRIRYGIPDVLGRERPRYAGRRTLVVGSGHSAFSAVIDLAALAAQEPGTEVLWAVRRRDAGLMFGGGEGDELTARGALGQRARALVAERGVRLETGFALDRTEVRGAALAVAGSDGRQLLVDEIVAATGFRPELEMLRELRLELDPVTEAPVRLAPLIDPNVHSCGSVPPHGAIELAHPEAGFYAVGMKSYGRAPTFLLLTGYEQVRSVVAEISGDAEAARRVELVLPETGVCSTAPAGVACCAPAPSAQPQEGSKTLPLAPAGGSCCRQSA